MKTWPFFDSRGLIKSLFFLLKISSICDELKGRMRESVLTIRNSGLA